MYIVWFWLLNFIRHEKVVKIEKKIAKKNRRRDEKMEFRTEAKVKSEENV